MTYHADTRQPALADSFSFSTTMGAVLDLMVGDLSPDGIRHRR
jgi:hypothetical protein